jgi:hypothetical protein
LPRGLHDIGARHITVLRDPLERAVSEYAFAESRGHVRMGVSPAKFFQQNNVLDNLQTRMLAGRVDLMSAETACMPGDAAAARENLLHRYALAGDLARFDDFLSVMLAMLKAPGILYFRRNITPLALPSALVEEIKAEATVRDHFDIALFAMVKNRIRHMPGTPLSAVTPACITFDNLDGTKGTVYENGPEPHISYLESLGIPVRRHVMDHAALVSRSIAAR